jgi:small subunit ribosomal protein S13
MSVDSSVAKTKLNSFVRVANENLPGKKAIYIALQSIYGIGKTFALKICSDTGLDPMSKIGFLTEEQTQLLRNRVTELVQSSVLIIGDELRIFNTQNIKKLIEIGNYRGLRHRRGLPVNGQRTKTNARTRKGKRKK